MFVCSSLFKEDKKEEGFVCAKKKKAHKHTQETQRVSHSWTPLGTGDDRTPRVKERNTRKGKKGDPHAHREGQGVQELQGKEEEVVVETQGKPKKEKMTENSSNNTTISKEALRAEHRFVRTEDEEEEAACAGGGEVAAARRAAVAAERALYKEYAVADLRAVRAGGRGLGLRWRTRAEVLAGKGTAVCAALDCAGTHGLRSYEVDFRYNEAGVARRALVKVRLCRACAHAAGWRHKHRHHKHHHRHHSKHRHQRDKDRDEDEETMTEVKKESSASE